MTNIRPKLEALCSDCGHLFALHWTTYNGKFGGCAGFDEPTAPGPLTDACFCRGFSIRYYFVTKV